MKPCGQGVKKRRRKYWILLGLLLCTPGALARIEHVEDDPAEAGRWMLEARAPASGYTAAIAVEGWLSRLVCLMWKECVS